MAVKQRAHGGPAFTRFDDPEVERVAKLLEEYARRWRVVMAGDVVYLPELQLEHPVPFPRPAEGGVVEDEKGWVDSLRLRVRSEAIMLRLRGSTDRLFRLIPPEDAHFAAALLVHLERNYGLISKLLVGVREWGDLAEKFRHLEALRRYAPLLGKDYNIPELKPYSGDVYRDFLEAAYALWLYEVVAPEAIRDALPAKRLLRRHAVNAPVAVPAAIRLPPPYPASALGARAVRAELSWFPEPTVRFLGEGGLSEDSLSEDSCSLDVLGASLLMLFEREQGLLARLAGAVEEKAKALEPFAEEALVAAEAGLLLFG